MNVKLSRPIPNFDHFCKHNYTEFKYNFLVYKPFINTNRACGGLLYVKIVIGYKKKPLIYYF